MDNSGSTAIQISRNTSTKDIVLSGLLISLVFLSTKFINIKLPISINGGLIHIGSSMLFMSSIVFGKKKGAAAGAFGMGLFDIVSGWAAWAPFTFVIRWVMGYLVGWISNAGERNGRNFFWNLAAVLTGSMWMLIGYFFAEVVIYGNWIKPFTSIPGNIVQIVVGALIGLPAAAVLKRTKLF